MKLKTKIQLLFGGTVVILMLLMGAIACYTNYENSEKIICDSMVTSADLTADHISTKLSDDLSSAEEVDEAVEKEAILAILEKIDISENGYAYLVSSTGKVLVHPDEEISGKLNILEENSTLAALGEKMIAGERGSGQYEWNGNLMFCGYSPVENSGGLSVVVCAPESDYTENLYGVIKLTSCLTILAIFVALIISTSLAGYVGKSVESVKDALVRIVKGDFSTKLDRSSKKDEIAVLKNSAAELVDTLSDIIGSSNRILGGIAQYDLTMADMRQYPGEFDRLSSSVNAIKNMLNQIIVKVQNTAAGVENGSTELSNAAAMLSEGTVMQASSIQKVVEDFGDVVNKINNNSVNASVVNENLMQLNEQIQNSNEEMTQLLAAVKEIEEMSADIQKIVGTIDSIAFQTNILALNAAVEAARAGESGKGFAVVADEVGSLASKCGDASQRTSELIDKCISSISYAKKCADSTFECLVNIVAGSDEISKAFGDISADTLEQAEKSNDIQKEIGQISDVVQSNTATAEQTAASTETLSNQAADLDILVRKFKVK